MTSKPGIGLPTVPRPWSRLRRCRTRGRTRSRRSPASRRRPGPPRPAAATAAGTRRHTRTGSGRRRAGRGRGGTARAASAVRQVPRDARAAGRTRPPDPTSRPRARSRVQNRSSTWGTTTIVVTRCVADRLEDHARVAAADVEDVRADRQRVEEGGRPARAGARAAAARRRGAPAAAMTRCAASDRRADVAVGQHHALGLARRARREDDLDEVVPGRSRPAVDLRLPVGRPCGFRRGGERPRPSRSGTCSRPASRGSGPSRPVPIARRAASAFVGDPLRSRRAPCAGRAARGRRRPASPRSRRPAARASRATRSAADRPRPTPELAQPPRGRLAAAVKLPEAPLLRAAVVPAQPQGGRSPYRPAASSRMSSSVCISGHMLPFGSRPIARVGRQTPIARPSIGDRLATSAPTRLSGPVSHRCRRSPAIRTVRVDLTTWSARPRVGRSCSSTPRASTGRSGRRRRSS